MSARDDGGDRKAVSGVDTGGVVDLPPGVEAATFREVMGSVCTPVTVVTAMTGSRPHGTTVSAFSALSLDPPMVLVCLDQGSELLRHIRHARTFGVNVLAATQAHVATAFARKGATKFDGVSWGIADGVPRLSGIAGWLACSLEQLVDGGDHVVLFGRAVTASTSDAAPLTYHQRRFGTHRPHELTNVRYLPRSLGEHYPALPPADEVGWQEECFAFN